MNILKNLEILRDQSIRSSTPSDSSPTSNVSQTERLPPPFLSLIQ